ANGTDWVVATGSNRAWTTADDAVTLITSDTTTFITARVVDIAGNTSTLTLTDNDYKYDNTPPILPNNLSGAVTISEDNGISDTDRTTNDELVRVTLTLTAPLPIADGKRLEVSANNTDWVVATMRTTGGSNLIWETADNAVTLIAGDGKLFAARVFDTAGNTSTLTLTDNDYKLDNTPPLAPLITSITDNIGGTTTIAKGETTNDSAPIVRVSLINTKADIGSKVELYIGSDKDPIGTITLTKIVDFVDIIPTNPLADGSHDITAKVVDKAGNKGAISDTYGITIDTKAPTKPNIVRIIDDVGSITDDVGKNGYTDDNEPTVRVNIAGTDAESGDKVRLYTQANTLAF
ncbi:MAG: hypothetical protein FE834_07045, partial [Gammaproteobacteria bacterium]|nr:hypothetical protein [Gammaproteobacteria bacterium]